MAEAIEILANVDNWGYRGYAYARAGRRDDAEKLAATTPRRAFEQALIFAGLGDKDRTLEALERMSGVGPVRLGRDLNYPEFALLRGDVRVKPSARGLVCRNSGIAVVFSVHGVRPYHKHSKANELLR